MTARVVCQTPEEAFRLGFEEPCAHGLPDPDDCPNCRLTDAEIGRLVVLLKGAASHRYANGTAAA